jgi:hypothetical protein
VVLGRLSAHWRQRVLDVLIESAAVPDHAVKLGRQTMHLRELSFEQLQEVGAKTMVPDWIQADLDLLITVGRFWGSDAVKRFHFVDPPERHEPSMMTSLLDKLRGLIGASGAELRRSASDARLPARLPAAADQAQTRGREQDKEHNREDGHPEQGPQSGRVQLIAGIRRLRRLCR